jgi:hypothetical protein
VSVATGFYRIVLSRRIISDEEGDRFTKLKMKAYGAFQIQKNNKLFHIRNEERYRL